jgi:hypothetical protein
MNIQILSKGMIENIIDRKIRTSIIEINKQLDYIHSRLDSLEENMKILKNDDDERSEK